MPRHFDLTGRTALVTGASSGLGRAFALSLADAGANVVFAARRIDRLEGLVGEAVSRGGKALAVAMDVADEHSITAGFDAAEATGPIDTVVVNAGVSHGGRSTEVSAEAFDDVFHVNVRGAFLTAREAARRMQKSGSAQSGRGRIVLIGSISAHMTLPGLTAYGASKAAVATMTRYLAREWANAGINVNVIHPGYVKTELNADWFEQEGGRRQVQSLTRKRLMREQDLLPILHYLCADEFAAVTGAAFTIDDGQGL